MNKIIIPLIIHVVLVVLFFILAFVFSSCLFSLFRLEIKNKIMKMINDSFPSVNFNITGFRTFRNLFSATQKQTQQTPATHNIATQLKCHPLVAIALDRRR